MAKESWLHVTAYCDLRARSGAKLFLHLAEYPLESSGERPSAPHVQNVQVVNDACMLRSTPAYVRCGRDWQRN